MNVDEEIQKYTSFNGIVAGDGYSKGLVERLNILAGTIKDFGQVDERQQEVLEKSQIISALENVYKMFNYAIDQINDKMNNFKQFCSNYNEDGHYPLIENLDTHSLVPRNSGIEPNTDSILGQMNAILNTAGSEFSSWYGNIISDCERNPLSSIGSGPASEIYSVCAEGLRTAFDSVTQFVGMAKPVEQEIEKEKAEKEVERQAKMQEVAENGAVKKELDGLIEKPADFESVQKLGLQQDKPKAVAKQFED